MKLGKVIGTVVPATVHAGLDGVPMLWVQPLTKTQQPVGRPVICADSTRMAGPGELIYYESSREAALALNPWFVPVDDAIVGIVDGVHLPQGEAVAHAAPPSAGSDRAPRTGPRRRRARAQGKRR
ncbi:MAG: ethanolamine utilization protein EutN [Candidatus Eisenbacteria bacterium]|nr:ethanolamine utilization protein EutN [Candidatus Eisenbacteria bacterium]